MSELNRWGLGILLLGMWAFDSAPGDIGKLAVACMISLGFGALTYDKKD